MGRGERIIGPLLNRDLRCAKVIEKFTSPNVFFVRGSGLKSSSLQHSTYKPKIPGKVPYNFAALIGFCVNRRLKKPNLGDMEYHDGHPKRNRLGALHRWRWF